MNLLSLDAVSKNFGGVKALSKVDLEISQGSIVGLVGPNGSGKTTLFNVITGIYPIDEGKIRFLDQQIQKLPTHKIINQGISRTFQNIRLFTDMSVLENVLVGYHRKINASFFSIIVNGSVAKKAEKAAVEKSFELLEFIGLVNEANKLAGDLSYGQQRRLEIARALASDPVLLLLDEPSAGMNTQEATDLNRFFLDLNQRMGKTIFIIEHNMDVVMNISEHVYCLDAGRIIAYGTPYEVQTNPKVQAAYLGE